MSKPFSLLVFDWDGTLMDSAARIVASFQATITHLGLESRTPSQIRHIIGLGLDVAIATLFPQTTASLRQQITQCYRSYFANLNLPTPLFPGVAETLTTLHAAGYQLAVATGKSRAGLQQALADSGLSNLFHCSRCAEETRSKPHPQMLQEIMAELKELPSATLMIGDTEYDLQMANNAKVGAVAVNYGVHDPAHLLTFQPLICLDTLPELLAWLPIKKK
jgi:phosphoglycolate phosphatase